MHNGTNITYRDGIYAVDQSENLKKLKKIPKEASDDAANTLTGSQNAGAAYPALLPRPNFPCYTSKFSQVTSKNFESVTRKRFNKFTDHCHENVDIHLKFVQIDLQHCMLLCSLMQVSLLRMRIHHSLALLLYYEMPMQIAI